jgi:hypothetical protein
MRQNQFQEDIKLNDSFDSTKSPCVAQDLGNPSVLARLQARIFAAQFDRQIEAGVIPAPGSPLAAHAKRLTSVRERESLARAFRRVADSNDRRPTIVDLRVPVLSDRVHECRDVIDDITLRLHSPRPVQAKGMARLRLLLSDGTGPLYFEGQGSLAGQVRGALAAL